MNDTLSGLAKHLNNLHCRTRRVSRSDKMVRYMRVRRDFGNVSLIGIQTYMADQQHGRFWVIVSDQITVRVDLVWKDGKMSLLPVELSDEDAVRVTLLTAHLR